MLMNLLFRVCFLYICMYICMYNLYIYIYIYIYLYINCTYIYTYIASIVRLSYIIDYIIITNIRIITTSLVLRTSIFLIVVYIHYVIDHKVSKKKNNFSIWKNFCWLHGFALHNKSIESTEIWENIASFAY